MTQVIHAMCALTALACAWLLLRGWWRTRVPLLLWSGLCFAGLTINNVLVVLDRMVLPASDLSLWRHVAALVGLGLLVFGLVRAGDR
jgi:hypothetical protein